MGCASAPTFMAASQRGESVIASGAKQSSFPAQALDRFVALLLAMMSLILSLRASAAAGAQLHRAIGDGEAERRADRSFNQADFAAMGAHQLGGDGKPETRAARSGR